MLDRTVTPKFKPVQEIQLIRPEHESLPNGIDLYVVRAGDAELVRVEFIFQHTTWNQALPLQNKAMAANLLEGAGPYTAARLAEEIDFYGAFLNADHHPDYTLVTLYSLNKHLEHTLPLVKEVLYRAAFPDTELKIYKQNGKQKLQVNLEKNDFLARRLFNSSACGDDTPYGYPVHPGDFDHITRDALLEAYRQQIHAGNCTILISGKVQESSLRQIEKLFGQSPADRSSPPFRQPAFEMHPGTEKKHLMERPKALQSAIRIGGPFPGKSHPDAPGLQVLNTLLGGYFGSRLMSNIREDKGYTYGIGSVIYPLKAGGIFYIATEVGADVCEKATGEIYKELNRLLTEPAREDELALVRNYMLGTFLGSLDNAFSHADKFKNMLLFGLDEAYYERYLETVRTITPVHLQELAGKYLSHEFYEVVVGKK